MRLATAGLVVPALCTALFADPILSLFTTDAMVIEAARPALRLFAISAVVDALPMVLVFSLLGAGATRFVAGVQIVQQYVILLPFAALLGLALGWGVLGMWVAMLISRAALAALAIRKMQGTTWQQIKV